MRLVFLTRFFICLKKQKSWSWDGTGSFGRYSSLCQNWLIQKQPSWPWLGEAHLAFFKDRSEIAKGKCKLQTGCLRIPLLLAPADSIVEDYLPADKRWSVLGKELSWKLPTWLSVRIAWPLRPILEQALDLPVTGKYNATNAMIASYVALQEGVSEEQIRQSFQGLELTRNRTEWKKAANGADILSDVYNANPTAMKLILETFSAIPANEGGKKSLSWRDMKELGDQSIQLHNQMILSLLQMCLIPLFSMEKTLLN